MLGRDPFTTLDEATRNKKAKVPTKLNIDPNDLFRMQDDSTFESSGHYVARIGCATKSNANLDQLVKDSDL